MKTPRRGLKALRFLRLQSNIKDVAAYEHRTSNAQHQILNEVFYLIYKMTERSDFIIRCSTFDVGRSTFKKRFTLPILSIFILILAGTVEPFRVARAEPVV